MFLSVGKRDFGVFDTVEFVFREIGDVVISPVVEKKVMQECAPRSGVMIQLQKFASFIGKIGDVHHMFVDGRVVMVMFFEFQELFMFANVTDNCIEFVFRRFPSVIAGYNFGRNGFYKSADLVFLSQR